MHRMRNVRNWILVGMILASLASLAPGRSAQAAQKFRLKVNGRDLTKWDVEPYEWTPGGRLMVQVNPVIAALGSCYHAPWYEAEQRKQVWASADCGLNKDAYVNFYKNSHIVEMYNGLTSIAGVVTYYLDVPAVEVNGAMVVSARALGDALSCYTEWVESASTFEIDCRRPPVIHQDLGSVMESYPPVLDRDTNKFQVPQVQGGFPMYPATLDAYVLKTEAANAVMGALRRDTDLLTVGYESWNGRARIFSIADRSRTIGHVYGDMTTLRLDPVQQVDFKDRLQKISARNTKVAAAGGIFLSVAAPEIQASRLLSGALKALGIALPTAAGLSSGKSHMERYENCREKAKLLAEIAGRDPATHTYVTVSMRFPYEFRCIPDDMGDTVLTWRDFEQLGY